MTMAHTDRDDDRNFWKRHYARGSDCTRRGYNIRGWCWCNTVHNGWTEPYRFEQGKLSWWKQGLSA